jgi:hypothetical protein
VIDIGAVALAVIIFLFWPALSVAIVLAVILLLVLGYTELAGRRRLRCQGER